VSVESIAPGQGGIVRTAGHAYAVYRRPDGSLSRCSAKCTHMGCERRWNTGEKSWDCTCHGSRFDPEGRVIAGPAIEDLHEVEARLTDHRQSAHLARGSGAQLAEVKSRRNR